MPELVERIHTRRGSDGAQLRALRNNLVFVVADDARQGGDAARLGAAFGPAGVEADRTDWRTSPSISRNIFASGRPAPNTHWRSPVQQCYRHIFYPSRNRVGVSGADLAHSAIELPATSDQPGAGQQQVLRALRELGKLRMSEDEPDSPTYVRDRTPLRHGEITTLALREEFRRDPALPILSGDDHVRPGHPARCRAGRLRLPPWRVVVRSRRPGGQHPDRRAGICADHGISPAIAASGLVPTRDTRALTTTERGAKQGGGESPRIQ